ncbi:MAG: DsbA family protein [Deltaproteobacteria bacterium]|jgi:2-hydroxychromene-2-carboxylate isomerase|nr:DsbA family protein [Deltaproteobacteria bacterium]
MDHIVEIFYSFQSPYCYLTIDRLTQLGEKFDIKAIWQPYMIKASNIGNAQMSDDQISYIKEDATRLAAKQGLPLNFIERWPYNEFDPEKSIRGALVASDLGMLYEYNIKMFQRWWDTAEDPNEQSFIIELCDDLDVDPNEYSGRINSSDVRDRVRGLTKRARTLGIFDIPMILINKERFYGIQGIIDAENKLAELGLKKA